MRCIDGLVTELLPDLPVPVRLHLRLAGAAHQMHGLTFAITADAHVCRQAAKRAWCMSE